MLVIAVLFWKRIAVELHLHRLRREASYFGSVLEGPRDTLAWKALELYADEPDGARALSERFAAGAIEIVSRPRLATRQRRPFEEIGFGVLGFGLASDRWRLWWSDQQHGSSGDSKYSAKGPDSVDGLHLIRIHEVLRGSRVVRAGACGAVERNGALFRLFPRDEAFLLTGSKRLHAGMDEHEDLIWVISRGTALPGEVKIPLCVLPPFLEASRTMSNGEEFLGAARETLRLPGVDADNPAPGLIERLLDAPFDCQHRSDAHPWTRTRRRHAFWEFIHPAARSLGDLGPAVLPALTESLTAGWPTETVQRALSVYQEIGEPSLPHLESLLKVIKGPAWRAALDAQRSIQRSLRPDSPAEEGRGSPTALRPTR